MKFQNLALASLLFGSITAFAGVQQEVTETTQRQADDLTRTLEDGNKYLDLRQLFAEDGLDSFESFASIESVAEDKNSFKRRPSPYTYVHNLAMSIETNFPVPFVGSQNYFGRIYFQEGNATKIDYRDEQTANKRYKDEMKNNRDFYTSSYEVSKINSKDGLNLVNTAGAVVNLRSTNFSPKTGGKLYLKVKAPKTDQMSMEMDVVVRGRSVQNYLIIGYQRYPFTGFTINADKSFLSGTSILNGILSIEFTQNGGHSYTINP